MTDLSSQHEANCQREKEFLLFFGHSPILAKKEANMVAGKLLPLIRFNSMLTSHIASYKLISQRAAVQPTLDGGGENNRDMIKSQLSSFQARIAGTVKIAEVVNQREIREERLPDISQWLGQALVGGKSVEKSRDKKLIFALSDYTRKKLDLLKLCRRVKMFLETQGVKARFILPKAGQTLSSAQVFHHQLFQDSRIEFSLIADRSILKLAQTMTVQNPDDWAKRDFGIPCADAKSGMLPPKLARMMVNLSGWSSSSDLIYDPFCGNGRILLEAALLGVDFVGADIDSKKVQATKANLRWLRSQYQLKLTDDQIDRVVFVADARNQIVKIEDEKLKKNRILVVTEPYLGPALHQLPTQEGVERIASSLSNLFVEFLKNFSHGASGGIVVFPAWKTRSSGIIRLREKVVDKLAGFGYRLDILGGYTRRDSFILREIIRISF